MSAARGSAGAGAGGSARESKVGGRKAPRPRAPRKGGKRKSGGGSGMKGGGKYSGAKAAKDLTPKEWLAAMEDEAGAKAFVAQEKRQLVDAAMGDLRRLADELDEDAWMFEPVSDLFDAGELHARETRQHSFMPRAHLAGGGGKQQDFG